MDYKEEDFIQLSGLQHFSFCRRQWALIHIENQWADNFRTADGSLLHKNAHDKGLRESRGDLIITRGMSIHSPTLGVAGECDVLELHRSESGIAMAGREGLWQPYPVEYKRGSGQSLEADSLQLCCQAMCLEEMLCCDIPEGALYYGEKRRRQTVAFTQVLRRAVREALAEMHQHMARGYTLKVRPTKACNACSLKDICLPSLLRRQTVSDYIRTSTEEQV